MNWKKIINSNMNRKVEKKGKAQQTKMKEIKFDGLKQKDILSALFQVFSVTKKFSP